MSRGRRSRHALTGLAGLALGMVALPACSGGSTEADAGAPGATVVAPSGSVLEAAADEVAPATSSGARAAEEEVVSFPAGPLRAGSTPGDPGRDPTLEPAQLELSLGAFDIDRDLFPNRPGERP